MSQPARIAIMLPRFSRYGGVEQYGYRLSEALAARGYQVDFICARAETPPPEGVRVIPVGRPGGFKILKMLWFLIQSERARRRGGYDLCISLGKTWEQDISRVGGGPLTVFWRKSERALPAGLPRLAKRLIRIASPANWLTLWIEKRQFGPGRQVVAVSDRVRDWLLQAYPDLQDVEVIYNRPDLSRYHPPSGQEREAARENLARRFSINLGGLADDPLFIGTATTNFRLKGIPQLIQSLAMLPANCHLFVAGGRGHGPYLHLARNLGLQDRVHFCGKVEDMPSFLHALDVFALATFYDACSNASLEALASGCRVLTTSNDGSSRFLQPEAIIPDPADVAGMAVRIGKISRQPLPPPFSWPENVPAGIDFFVAKVESMLSRMRDTPST